jgi:hypothetical protein
VQNGPAVLQTTDPVHSAYRPELNLLTGIAAILTYPLDVEIVEMEEREEKERLEALNKEEEQTTA